MIALLAGSERHLFMERLGPALRGNALAGLELAGARDDFLLSTVAQPALSPAIRAAHELTWPCVFPVGKP